MAPLPTSRPTPIPETAGEGTRSLSPPGRRGPRLIERSHPRSPPLASEPTPILLPPSAPNWALRGERFGEQRNRAPPPGTADQRFSVSQLAQGTPGAEKCHKPTSPRAAPAQDLNSQLVRDILPGRRPRTIVRGRSLGGGTREGAYVPYAPPPRGQRPLPPRPGFQAQTQPAPAARWARGRDPQHFAGVRGRDGIPAGAWPGQDTHQWTRA